MNKKSFFWGVLTGFILTFTVLFIIGWMNKNSDDDDIQYFESPLSFEDKREASFRVFQVWGDYALAAEEGLSLLGHNGTTVLLIGDNLYNDQVVKVKNPMRIGNYSYTTKDGRNLTVPVIDCSN